MQGRHDGHPKRRILHAASCKLQAAGCVRCKRCSSCLLWHQQATLSLPQPTSLPLALSTLTRFSLSFFRSNSTRPLLKSRICRHGALFNDTIRATPTHANKLKAKNAHRACRLLLQLQLLNWCPSDRNWRKNVTRLHSLDMHRSSQRNVKLAARLSTHQKAALMSV